MSLENKTVLITGASRGIGKVTAHRLAEKGAHVVLLCRDRGRGEQAMNEIASKVPGARLDLILADLSSQKEVRAAAAEYKRRFARLDVLVNNAGAIFAKREVTVDGLELTFATNHVAYFLLTNLLLDTIVASKPARIVNVSSMVHTMGKIDFDDLQSERGYSPMGAYSQSKLANVLFTYELARRLKGTGVTVNCLHPGAVASNFARNNGRLWNFVVRLGAPFMETEESGAKTSVHLASSPDVEGVTGKYFAKSREKSSSRASHDEALAKRLWDVTEALTRATVANGRTDFAVAAAL